MLLPLRLLDSTGVIPPEPPVTGRRPRSVWQQLQQIVDKRAPLLGSRTTVNARGVTVRAQIAPHPVVEPELLVLPQLPELRLDAFPLVAGSRAAARAGTPVLHQGAKTRPRGGFAPARASGLIARSGCVARTQRAPAAMGESGVFDDVYAAQHPDDDEAFLLAAALRLLT